MTKRMRQFINNLQQKANSLLFIIAFTLTLSSCDSILNYDEGDCSVEYLIKFKYDYNLKYANAFANEVERVTLYAFDENGQFVYQKIEEGERLKADDYAMKVDIEPGKYHLVAWAGKTDDSFAIPLLSPGASDIEELTAKTIRSTLTRAADGEAINLVDKNLASLFHGESLQTFTRAGGKQNVITVPLVKNTNSFHIVLQQMQGVPIDVNNFEFSIQDDNGYMNYDNSLLEDQLLTYQPYKRSSASITRAANGDSSETTVVSTASVDLKVGRLMADKNPRLKITNIETKETVLSIPLIQYLIMSKTAEYEYLDAQEYLDRQDAYSMMFFLDPNLAWINTTIEINGWTVHLNDTDL